MDSQHAKGGIATDDVQPAFARIAEALDDSLDHAPPDLAVDIGLRPGPPPLSPSRIFFAFSHHVEVATARPPVALSARTAQTIRAPGHPKSRN